MIRRLDAKPEPVDATGFVEQNHTSDDAERKGDSDLPENGTHLRRWSAEDDNQYAYRSKL